MHECRSNAPDLLAKALRMLTKCSRNAREMLSEYSRKSKCSRNRKCSRKMLKNKCSFSSKLALRNTLFALRIQSEPLGVQRSRSGITMIHPIFLLSATLKKHALEAINQREICCIELSASAHQPARWDARSRHGLAPPDSDRSITIVVPCRRTRSASPCARPGRAPHPCKGATGHQAAIWKYM